MELYQLSGGVSGKQSCFGLRGGLIGLYVFYSFSATVFQRAVLEEILLCIDGRLKCLLIIAWTIY